jgi:hypothetical protein
LRERGWGCPSSDKGTYTVVLYIYTVSTLWPGQTFGGENARGVPGTLEQGHPEVLRNVLGRGGLVLLHTILVQTADRSHKNSKL